MFFHSFKIAWRNLARRKGISAVKIGGLAVGMASAILIFLWVGEQMGYDRWLPNGDRIFRLGEGDWAVLPPILRDTALALPEVQTAVRFSSPRVILKIGENTVRVDDFVFADEDVLDVFRFRFLAGDPRTALKNPRSLILAESLARSLFGDLPALGKVVRLNGLYDYTVTGVMADPRRFHLKIRALAPLRDMVAWPGNERMLAERTSNFPIYLITAPGADARTLADKITTRARNVDKYKTNGFSLRPFKDIYFGGALKYEWTGVHGNRNLVLAFFAVGLLLLAMASVNFVNLTVADAGRREKEIAVKKTIGAIRRTLGRQFFAEIALVAGFAFLLALLLAGIALPAFNALVRENIGPDSLDARMAALLAGVFVLAAALSGLYPARFLARLQPAALLRGRSGKGRNRAVFGKLLIGFQFSIAVFLVIWASTAVRQLRYMQTKDLGLRSDGIIATRLWGEAYSSNEKSAASKKLFTRMITASPAVKDAAFINQPLGSLFNSWGFYTSDPEKRILCRMAHVSPNFVRMMGIEVLKGRDFDERLATDRDAKCLLNEEAVRLLGSNPTITRKYDQLKLEVIGVVRDFHFNSLHEKISPLVIVWSDWPSAAMVKIARGNIEAAIQAVQDACRRISPEIPFAYEFLDQSYAKQYQDDRRLERILNAFVVVAVFLSGLGLFALTAAVAERRTKEIGVRKVLGATNGGIVVLISRHFVGSILLANVVAWPMAYLMIGQWLRGFPYRVGPSAGVFLAGGGVAFAVAMLTIGFQARKAAAADPAKSLKYE